MLGSDDWWMVVLTMPLHESLTELHRYRSLLLEETKGTPDYLQASKKITRVNDEIKQRNRRVTESQWRAACKKVLPQELYDAVCIEVRIVEDGLKVSR
jgi:hypothetical protein